MTNDYDKRETSSWLVMIKDLKIFAFAFIVSEGSLFWFWADFMKSDSLQKTNYKNKNIYSTARISIRPLKHIFILYKGTEFFPQYSISLYFATWLDFKLKIIFCNTNHKLRNIRVCGKNSVSLIVKIYLL